MKGDIEKQTEHWVNVHTRTDRGTFHTAASSPVRVLVAGAEREYVNLYVLAEPERSRRLAEVHVCMPAELVREIAALVGDPMSEAEKQQAREIWHTVIGLCINAPVTAAERETLRQFAVLKRAVCEGLEGEDAQP